jgi:hypothetical protein
MERIVHDAYAQPAGIIVKVRKALADCAVPPFMNYHEMRSSPGYEKDFGL